MERGKMTYYLIGESEIEFFNRNPDYPYRGQIRISQNSMFDIQTHFDHFGTFGVWMGDLE